MREWRLLRGSEGRIQGMTFGWCRSMSGRGLEDFGVDELDKTSALAVCDSGRVQLEIAIAALLVGTVGTSESVVIQ